MGMHTGNGRDHWPTMGLKLRGSNHNHIHSDPFSVYAVNSGDSGVLLPVDISYTRTAELKDLENKKLRQEVCGRSCKSRS